MYFILIGLKIHLKGCVHTRRDVPLQSTVHTTRPHVTANAGFEEKRSQVHGESWRKIFSKIAQYAVRRRWPTSQPCAAVTLRNTHTLTMATSASKGIPVLWQRVTLEGQEKAKELSRTRDKGSPREAAGLRPTSDCSRSISQQMWVHSTHTLPSLQSSRRNFPSANKTPKPHGA